MGIFYIKYNMTMPNGVDLPELSGDKILEFSHVLHLNFSDF